MENQLLIRQAVVIEKECLELNGIYWETSFGYCRNFKDDSCDIVSVEEVKNLVCEYIDNKLKTI